MPSSEVEHPEDPDNLSDKKKKKKRKSERQQRRHCREGKAFATSKIVVTLPEFTEKDFKEFAESLGRFSRMTCRTHTSGGLK